MMTEKELEARLQIAAWMETVTEPGIQAQEERRKQKNAEIREKLERGEVVYGARYYTPAMYREYELTGIKLDFTVYSGEKLGPYTLHPVTEAEKRAFYEENPDLFTRFEGDSFGYGEVSMIIEKRLKEKEYENIVQDILC